MPGIVGYVGRQDAGPLILAGLRRLEYWDYDSAGIAIQTADGALVVRRRLGRLTALERRLAAEPVAGQSGIGHTRWATHGRPAEANAHPLTDCSGEIVVAHSGIIENLAPLQTALRAQGHTFRSETDTEVLPHLIEQRLRDGAPDMTRAVAAVLGDLAGAHTVVTMYAREPGKIWAARRGADAGLIVGYGAGEMFLASDQPAILDHTRTLASLDPDELVVLTADEARYSRFDGTPLAKATHTSPWDLDAAARHGYRHFTQREIYEQPEAAIQTLFGRLDPATGAVFLDGVRYSVEELRAITRLVLVGAGASWYSALAGKHMFETLARLPVEVESAGEFRYRDPPLDGGTLVVALSQSGKTADTLESLALAGARGARRLVIANALDSPAERLADGVVYMHAGPEVSVAATKSFTCSLVDQALLAAALGWARGALAPARAVGLAAALGALPGQMRAVLADDELYGMLAAGYYTVPGFLCLGQGINYPVALEAAHLLKQLGYIRAEGLPAGELAHGPQAIVDPSLPVLAVAPQGIHYAATLHSVRQANAQGAPVIALATEGDSQIADVAAQVIYLPATDPLLEPVLAILPLQMLAYELAVLRGCAVDRPRFVAHTLEAG